MPISVKQSMELDNFISDFRNERPMHHVGVKKPYKVPVYTEDFEDKMDNCLRILEGGES